MNNVSPFPSTSTVTAGFDAEEAEQRIESLRSDLDVMHAIVRDLIPLSRNTEKARAIALGREAITRFAEAAWTLHLLKADVLREDVQDEIDQAAE